MIGKQNQTWAKDFSPKTKDKPPFSVQNVQFDWGLGIRSLKAESSDQQKATIKFC